MARFSSSTRQDRHIRWLCGTAKLPGDGPCLAMKMCSRSRAGVAGVELPVFAVGWLGSSCRRFGHTVRLSVRGRSPPARRRNTSPGGGLPVAATHHGRRFSRPSDPATRYPSILARNCHNTPQLNIILFIPSAHAVVRLLY